MKWLVEAGIWRRVDGNAGRIVIDSLRDVGGTEGVEVSGFRLASITDALTIRISLLDRVVNRSLNGSKESRSVAAFSRQWRRPADSVRAHGASTVSAPIVTTALHSAPVAKNACTCSSVPPETLRAYSTRRA